MKNILSKCLAVYIEIVDSFSYLNDIFSSGDGHSSLDKNKVRKVYGAILLTTKDFSKLTVDCMKLTKYNVA